MTNSFSPRVQCRRLLLCGLLTAAAIGPGCALLQDDLQPPTVRVIGLTPESGSLSELRIRCRLSLKNPNDVSLPIKGGELQLALASRTTAQGRLDDDVTIPPFESREVDAIVAIDVMSAISIIATLMSTGNMNLPYEIEGFVDVGITRLGRVHFSESGALALNEMGDMIGTQL